MRLTLSGLAIGLAAQAQAQTFERCTKVEIEVIQAAIDGAEVLALNAAGAVGDTDVYRRWFGPYSPRNGEQVRNALKAINDALSESVVHARCGNLDEEGCKGGETYAWVYRTEPFRINLCPNFFEMPVMFEYDSTDSRMENGTREGTIIHELSHFGVVADTDDICYSRGFCSDLARRSPGEAIRNADSYQYFAEDIGYFPPIIVVRGLTGRQAR